MKSCIDCIHYNVCETHQVDEREDKCAKRCHHYLEYTRVIVLPINLTRELHSELEYYCYERCVDEL